METVRVQKDMAELANEYLENRRQELPRLYAFLREGNLKAFERLAHNMKGNGASYGFPRFTELGSGLEAAAKQQDTTACEALLRALEVYLSTVQIEVEAESA